MQQLHIMKRQVSIALWHKPKPSKKDPLFVLFFIYPIVLLFHQTTYFFFLCSLNVPFKIGKTAISWKKKIPTIKSTSPASSHSLVKICCGTPLPADHSFFNLELQSCVASSLFNCLYGMYFFLWQLQQAIALKHTLFEGKWLKIEDC